MWYVIIYSTIFISYWIMISVSWALQTITCIEQKIMSLKENSFDIYPNLLFKSKSLSGMCQVLEMSMASQTD